jgi:Tol biopolymer transport system component
MAEPRWRQGLIHEARALSSLNHPHVAALFDVVNQDGCECLVMEYVPGAPLDKIIPPGGMPVDLALRYALQITDALVAAHAQRIIHRDLKPSNIVVTPEGSVKLLDFGIAKHFGVPQTLVNPSLTVTSEGSATTPGSVVGTPAFMSPEQVAGQNLDERTDIFSFGAVFYEMTTGRRAFARPNTLTTVAAILHQDPVRPRDLVPTLPQELDRIIWRCLKKDPEQRFRQMADIKALLEDFTEEVKLDTRSRRSSGKLRPRWVAAGLVVGAALLVVAGAAVWTRSKPAAAPEMSAAPLTSYPGFEFSPSLSPDGTLVAFEWDGPHQNNWDIYVKLIGEGNPLRLTTDTAPDLSPAWSPDGRLVAFVRVKEDRGLVMVVPGLGGQERTLAVIQAPSGHSWRRNERLLAWTPDGNWLVVPRADPQSGSIGLSLLAPQSGETRTLTSAPPDGSGVRDYSPAFSPDGSYLAFARSAAREAADVWLLPLATGYRSAGPLRRLTDGRGLNDGPTWTSDGRRIVFHSNRTGESAIWSLPATGGQPSRLAGVGANGKSPALSRQGRLVYVESPGLDSNIWGLELKKRGTAAANIIFSSRADTSPQYSPDGRAVVFQSDRQGTMEIWISQADGSRPYQLTNFGRGHTGTPRWSPDGKRVAFDASVSGEFQVYVVDAEGGEPRRLTQFRALAAIPSWSQDGQWIYFTSPQSGREEIWKIPAGGGEARQITSTGGSVPFESRDGSRIFYLRDGSIRSMPRDGGEESTVVEKIRNRNYAVGRDGVYFERDVAPSRVAICYRPFAGGREIELYRTLKPTHSGLTVSPEEAFLLYTQVDYEGSDLKLVNSFR